jgi:hypothetical protein
MNVDDLVAAIDAITTDLDKALASGGSAAALTPVIEGLGDLRCQIMEKWSLNTVDLLAIRAKTDALHDAYHPNDESRRQIAAPGATERE